MQGQKGGMLWASSSGSHSHAVTVAMGNRNIFAEVALVRTYVSGQQLDVRRRRNLAGRREQQGRELQRGLPSEFAVDHVRQHTRKNAKNLAVVHGDPKKPPDFADRIAFDLKKKKLVTLREPLALQDFATLESAAEKPVSDRSATRGKRPKKAS